MVKQGHLSGTGADHPVGELVLVGPLELLGVLEVGGLPVEGPLHEGDAPPAVGQETPTVEPGTVRQAPWVLLHGDAAVAGGLEAGGNLVLLGTVVPEERVLGATWLGTGVSRMVRGGAPVPTQVPESVKVRRLLPPMAASLPASNTALLSMSAISVPRREPSLPSASLCQESYLRLTLDWTLAWSNHPLT